MWEDNLSVLHVPSAQADQVREPLAGGVARTQHEMRTQNLLNDVPDSIRQEEGQTGSCPGVEKSEHEISCALDILIGGCPEEPWGDSTTAG